MFAFISSVVLLIMYFIVFIISSLIFFMFGYSGIAALTFSFLVTFIFVLLQFFLSPILYDFMLQILYKAKFVSVDELPRGVADFIRRVFEEKSVKLPKIGIIDDYTPTAFTYGNFPSNARIVVSRGLIDMMDEEEIKAVIAHEMGHIFHYDFIFMTLAALVPILLYYLYRVAINLARSSGSSSRGRGGGAAPILLIAIVTFILYIISEYVVLYLSRLREYYADRYSAYLTGNPNALATALIKVGYGLLNFQANESKKDQENTSSGESFYKSPFKVLGLMDAKQARGISLAVINAGAVAVDTATDTSNVVSAVAKVMAWDLFNPWASVLEFSSTHPLIAKRIKNLYNISREIGMPFSIEIPKSLPREQSDGIDINPNSLWDEFFIDLFFEYAPLNFSIIGLILGSILTGILKFNLVITLFLFGLALGSILKWTFAYKGDFKVLKIFDLLSKTKVSRIRAIPAIVEGEIVGRGVAGYILSEDVLLKDDTGFVYVDYKTGISWGDLAYGFFVTKNLIGKKAKIKGYFRRSLFPYFEAIEIIMEDGKKYRSYFKYFWLAGAILMLIASILSVFLFIL
ncbi:MAG: M48 family metalloprotease [bacterium]